MLEICARLILLHWSISDNSIQCYTFLYIVGSNIQFQLHYMLRYNCRWVLDWCGSRKCCRYVNQPKFGGIPSFFITAGLIVFFFSLLSLWIADSFSLIGTIFGVLGSISLSLYSIYTKKTLPKINDKVLLLNFYVNVYAIFLFIPMMLFSGELNVVIRYQHLNELWFWIALSVGGICGFSIGYVTGLQIKVTSPLTHNISGTAKACAQTILATHWNHEIRSKLWWFSNVVVLFGSSLYARVKQIEMDKRHNQQLIQPEKA